MSLIHKIINTYFSPIYLYHSVQFENKILSNKNSKIHNVNYDEVCSQLQKLSKNMDFVSIDQWFDSKNKRGLAAITFDDAYLNIFDGILKELINLKIPSCVFLIGKSLENQLHWREKVTFIIGNKLVYEFEKFLSVNEKKNLRIDFNKFYSSSKKLHVSSQLLEKKIDEFIKINKIEIKSKLINSSSQLISNPYVCYGNHSYNHYLLSTLDYESQYEDIQKSKKTIEKLEVNTTDTFAVPFGGYRAINKDTILALKKLSINKVLLTNNLFEKNIFKDDDFKIAYRYLPTHNKKNNYKLWYTLFKSLTRSSLYKVPQ